MFECKECKKRFSCNSSLQEHMACHSGAKPLSCHVCDRKFRQVAVLKRHIVTHSNEKPFACGICGKRFSMKVYVQSHMKTHTGQYFSDSNFSVIMLLFHMLSVFTSVTNTVFFFRRKTLSL